MTVEAQDLGLLEEVKGLFFGDGLRWKLWIPGVVVSGLLHEQR